MPIAVADVILSAVWIVPFHFMEVRNGLHYTSFWSGDEETFDISIFGKHIAAMGESKMF